MRLRSESAPIVILVYACVTMLGLQAIHGIDPLRGDRRAPLAAALAGTFIAVAFATVHLAPDWGLLSDPYSEASLGGFSWAVMLVGLAAATTFAVIGLSFSRAGSPADPAKLTGRGSGARLG